MHSRAPFSERPWMGNTVNGAIASLQLLPKERTFAATEMNVGKGAISRRRCHSAMLMHPRMGYVNHHEAASRLDMHQSAARTWH